jgi:putative ABC transport system permease protein
MIWPWEWKRRNEDLDTEIQTHFDMARQDQIDRGHRNEAGNSVRLQFGNVELVKEVTRDMWNGRWARDFLKDIAFALRMLRKTALVSASLVLVTGLGIGAGTALFSIADASFHKSDPNWYRWGAVTGQEPLRNLREFRFSIPEYVELAGIHDVFEKVGALRYTSAALTTGDYPERVGCAHITSNVLLMSGHPLLFLGRNFRPAEDRPGGPQVAILSYEFWQSHFSEDRHIVGRDIRLDGRHYTIIGVTIPRESAFSSDVMVPLQPDLSSQDRANRELWVLTWLRRGQNWAHVDARLNAYARQAERDHGSQYPEYVGLQLQFWNGYEAMRAGIRPAMTILVAAVALLLFICCANIGGLILARVVARQREFALRAALGAARDRILRQLLTETLTLACLGGVAGFLIARFCLPILVHSIPRNWLPLDPALITLNGRILFATTGLTLFIGLVFGILPGWLASQVDLTTALAHGGQRGTTGSRQWIRSALIVGQIAFTFVVLAGAALMIQSYRQSSQIDLGFRPERILSFQISLPPGKYPDSLKAIAFFEAMLHRQNGLPAVEGAAVVSGLPLSDRFVDLATADFTLPGRLSEGGRALANANYRLVSPRYFDVIQARLVRGRFFRDQDRFGSAPVAVVNETMANLFWPNSDPIGQKFRLNEPMPQVGPAASDTLPPTLTVIGVVHNLKQTNVIAAPIRQEFYLSNLQFFSREMTIMVRSQLNAEQLAPAVRRAVASLDVEQPIYSVRTMNQVVAESFGPARITTILLAFFAGVTLPLASIGLYALISYSVAQRVREIGLRKALGAQPSQIVTLILRSGMRLSLAGIILGVACGLALAQLMARQSYALSSTGLLYDVSPTSPLLFGTVSVLIGGVTFVACFIPALRALRMNAMNALRCE